MNSTEDENGILNAALEALEAKLQKYDEQIRELLPLAEQYERTLLLVNSMRAVLGLPSLPARSGSAQSKKVPIWRRAHLIIQQSGKPLTLDQIVTQLRGFGVDLRGRSGKETVRAILHKKQDVFENNAGFYSIRSQGLEYPVEENVSPLQM